MATVINHVGEIVSRFDKGDVIDCDACGYKHVMPLPTTEQLKKFYEQEFYQTEKSDYLETSAEDVEWKNIEFERRFQLAESKLDNVTKKVLDIGCGPGDFLAVGMERGWQVTGIEPSPVAADYASKRNLSVIHGFFDQRIVETLDTFDFIHMSEVLEHIPNPSELLDWAMQLLSPGGVLCISVPNDFSPIQKVLTDTNEFEPWWVVPDHHLNYFDFDTLAALIKKAGFELLESTTNFPMELFLLMGQNYTKDNKLGRELHQRRKAFDITMSMYDPELLNRFYTSLAEAKMGRLAIQFARKPQ